MSGSMSQRSYPNQVPTRPNAQITLSITSSTPWRLQIAATASM